MLTSNPTEYSDFVYYIANAMSWLESVFEGLVDTIFSNWLLSGFLCTIIFLSVLSIVLWFFDDVTDASSEYTLMKHRKLVREAAADEKHKQRLSEAEERYQKRKEQNRAEAEERYRKRQAEKYPNLFYKDAQRLADGYFEENPYKISFSYNGQTFYNNEALSRYHMKGLKLVKNDDGLFWVREKTGEIVEKIDI